MAARKRYSKGFTLDTISLGGSELHRNRSGQSLGIQATIYWAAGSKSSRPAFRGNGTLTPEQVEVRQLQEKTGG